MIAAALPAAPHLANVVDRFPGLRLGLEAQEIGQCACAPPIWDDSTASLRTYM